MNFGSQANSTTPALASAQGGTGAPRLVLRPFDRLYAPTVASWVRDAGELALLAPVTPPPLTVAKIVGWHKPGFRPLLLFGDGEALPCGYAELNPLRGSHEHLWIGHLIVAPSYRRRGIGSELVRLLLAAAFADPPVARVSMVVFPENEPALRCYQSCGFRVVSTEHHRFRRGGPLTPMLRLEATAP